MNHFLYWLIDDNGRYMPTFDCLGKDWLMASIVIFLNLSILAGYLMIARHWFRNRKRNLDPNAKDALKYMVWIFLLCGVCGYGFQIIRMFYPLWPLYIFFMFLLSGCTWYYVFQSKTLQVVYRELREHRAVFEKIDEILKGIEARDVTESDIKVYEVIRQIKDSATKASASIDLLASEFKNNNV